MVYKSKFSLMVSKKDYKNIKKLDLMLKNSEIDSFTIYSDDRDIINQMKFDLDIFADYIANSYNFEHDDFINVQKLIEEKNYKELIEFIEEVKGYYEIDKEDFNNLKNFKLLKTMEVLK